MALCKYCNKPFSWGQMEGKWVPLVPVEEHEGLDREYQDEEGVLRAAHWQVCVRRGGPTVRVVKLAKKIKANEIIGGGPTGWTEPDADGVIEPIYRGYEG